YSWSRLRSPTRSFRAVAADSCYRRIVGRLSAICLVAAAACGRSGFNDYTPIDSAPHTGDGHAAGDAASGDTPNTGDAGADGPPGSQVAFVGSPIQHT